MKRLWLGSCRLLLGLCSVAVATVTFEDCGSTGKVESFTCSSCQGDEIMLKKGTDVNFELTFTPKEDTPTLTNDVVGILGGGVEMPYNNMMDTNVCAGLKTGSCPVKGGTKLVFASKINVLPKFPTIPVTIKWTIKCAQGKSVVCIKLKAKITD